MAPEPFHHGNSVFLSFGVIKKVLEVVKSALRKSADALMALKKKAALKSIFFALMCQKKKSPQLTASARSVLFFFSRAKAQRRFQSIASVLVFWRGRVSAGIR